MIFKKSYIVREIGITLWPTGEGSFVFRRLPANHFWLITLLCHLYSKVQKYEQRINMNKLVFFFASLQSTYCDADNRTYNNDDKTIHGMNARPDCG